MPLSFSKDSKLFINYWFTQTQNSFQLVIQFDLDVSKYHTFPNMRLTYSCSNLTKTVLEFNIVIKVFHVCHWLTIEDFQAPLLEGSQKIWHLLTQYSLVCCLASSPRDKRRADRDSLDLPPSLSPPPQLQGSQPPPYGMLPPQYQHLQNHMGPMMAPPQFQPPYQGPLNHMDSGEIPMDHGMQAIDECMMRPQQFNPGDMGGYPTTTNHNGQNHLELMHDMINSF